MKVVVISDTHLPKRAKQLPQILEQDLADTDLLIHAGDWQTLEVYNQLKNLTDVVGVTGNIDDPELKTILGERLIIDLSGYRIGVIHGHGKGKTTEKRAFAAFESGVDCIIYGHSHIPVNKYHEGILLFNPGSPTDKRRQAQYSYGIINFGEKIEARHVFFDS